VIIIRKAKEGYLLHKNCGGNSPLFIKGISRGSESKVKVKNPLDKESGSIKNYCFFITALSLIFYVFYLGFY
jgi:hypothetical protein